jgi:hypothetical protein
MGTFWLECATACRVNVATSPASVMPPGTVYVMPVAEAFAMAVSRSS